MIKIPMEESQEVGEKDGEVREKGIDLVNPKMEEKVKGLELGMRQLIGAFLQLFEQHLDLLGESLSKGYEEDGSDDDNDEVVFTSQGSIWERKGMSI